MNEILPILPPVFDLSDLLKSYENHLAEITMKTKNLKKNIRFIKKVQESQKKFEMMIHETSGVSPELCGPKG